VWQEWAILDYVVFLPTCFVTSESHQTVDGFLCMEFNCSLMPICCLLLYKLWSGFPKCKLIWIQTLASWTPIALAYVSPSFPLMFCSSVNESFIFVLSCNLCCPLVLIINHLGPAVNMDVVVEPSLQPICVNIVMLIMNHWMKQCMFSFHPQVLGSLVFLFE